MENTLLKALYFGKIQVGDKSLSCAVLEDETRVLTGTAVYHAFGKSRRGLVPAEKGWRKIPDFLSPNNLKPFVSKVFMDGGNFEIEYIGNNGKVITGYKAELLPEICEAILKARREKKLLPTQQPLAVASEILLGVFAKIGIIALIDEVTGYQEVRKRNALNEFLSMFLTQDKAKWAKTFPDEYYIQLFRLLGWEYNPLTVKRPRYLGKLTNNIVYERIAPYVLEKLNELNPIINNRRKYTHHQFLTPDLGLPELHNHLLQAIAIMKTTDDIKSFINALDRALPKQTNKNEVMIIENPNEDE